MQPRRLTRGQRDLLNMIRYLYGGECWHTTDLADAGRAVAARYKGLRRALWRLEARGYLESCGRGSWRLRASQERPNE